MLKNPEVFYSPLEFSLELRSPIRDGEEGDPEGSNPTPHESPPGPQRRAIIHLNDLKVSAVTYHVEKGQLLILKGDKKRCP